MMDRFYSPTTRGFYSELTHGSRLLAEPQTEQQIKAGRKPRYVPNPNCTIPADAMPVSEAEWHNLLAAQGEGKMIAVEAGRVVAVDPVKTAEEQLAAIRARRDRLLLATDPMVTVPDYPITVEQRAELLAWRQALRDFPDAIAPSLPSADVEWPPRPSWIGEQGEKL